MSDRPRDNQTKVVRVLETHRARLAANEQRLAAQAEAVAALAAQKADLALLQQARRETAQAASTADSLSAELKTKAAGLAADAARRDDVIAAALRREIQENAAGVSEVIQQVARQAHDAVARLSGETQAEAVRVALALAELAEKGSAEWLLQIYKGTYRDGQRARRGELWTYYGSTFLCLADTNQPPFNAHTVSKNWALFASAGSPGATGAPGGGGGGGGGGGSLPDQTGQAGKFLTTDGAAASWATASGSGDMLAANNLSDVANAATAFANIKQAASTTVTGVVELATDGESAASVVVQGNDSRLADARPPTAHASTHTNGTDDIQNATAAQKGLATAAQITKLDGIEAAADVTDAGNVASSIHGVAGKITPVDADELGLLDSVASFALKVLTWANLKATLKTYFDTLYQAAGSYLTSGGALGTPSSGTLTNCTGLPAAGGGTGQSTYAKGDLLASPGSNTLNKLAVGSDGQVLTADAASTNGVKWAAASGGGTSIWDLSILEFVALFGGSSTPISVPYRGVAIGSGTLTNYFGNDMDASEIRTGTTSGWGYSIMLLSGANTNNIFDLDETHVWRMKWLIRTGASVANYRLVVGAVGTSGAAVPVDGIGVRFDTSVPDTNFRLVAWSGSTPTLGSDNLRAPAINTVYTVEIWCTGDGTVRATVNGGTQSTLTTGFTSTRVTPYVHLINSAAADKRLQISRLAFRVEGLAP